MKQRTIATLSGGESLSHKIKMAQGGEGVRGKGSDGLRGRGGGGGEGKRRPIIIKWNDAGGQEEGGEGGFAE